MSTSIYGAKNMGFQACIEYTVTQDITGNQSKLDLILWVLSGTSGSYNSSPGSAYYILDGTKSYQTYSFATKGEWHKIATKSITVPHNDDGTKSYTLSATWCSGQSTAYTPWSVSVSQTITLPTIARATTPSAPATIEIGSTITVKLTPADSSYKHRLWWRIKGEGEDAWAQLGGILGTGYTWATPLADMCRRITNASTGTLELYAGTYTASDKLVGTRTATFTLTVPASVVPTISAVALAPVNSNAWIAGKGAYVQGYTKARVQTTAVGVYGSIIKTVVATVDKKNYSGGDITTDVLPGGSLTIDVTATDSRGRKATQRKIINVLPYTPPYVDGLTFERGQYKDGQWTAKYGGLDVRVDCNAVVSLQDIGNTAHVVVSAVGLVTQSTDDAVGQCSFILSDFGVDHTRAIIVTMTDKLGNSSEKSIPVPSMIVDYSYNPVTHLISVGRVAERPYVFDDYWDTVLHKGLCAPNLGSRVIVVDMMDYDDLTEAGYECQDTPESYYAAWIKWLCATYPNHQNVTFLGLTRPNFICTTMFAVYDTATLKNGLPKYSGGQAVRCVQGKAVHYFGTDNHVYGCTTETKGS